MNTLLSSEDFAGSTRLRSGSKTLCESRDTATTRVLTGGAAALCGTASFLAGGFLGAGASLVSYISITVGGLALAGVGAVTIGRAASHLLRYGKAGSAKTLLAVAGLGGSLSVFAATHLLLVLEVGADAIVRALNTGALGGTLVFGGALLLIVLGTITRWVFDFGAE